VMTPASADASHAESTINELRAQRGLAPLPDLDPTLDTLQEPSPATSQDRATDTPWQNAMSRALLELDF